MKANVLRQTEGSLETKLARFLFAYRTTPQSTTTVTPAELMFGRKIKSASHQTIMVLRLDSIEERKNCCVFRTVILCTIVTIVNKTNEYLKIVLCMRDGERRNPHHPPLP